MRVTNYAHMQNWLKSQRKVLERLNRAELSVMSEKALQVPSDNPAGMSRVINLNQQVRKQNNFNTAIQDGLGWLKMEELTMDSVSDALADAKELALTAVNGTITSQESYSLMIIQADELIEYVVSLANTTYGGQYIFSGDTTDIMPFKLNSGGTAVEPYAGGNGALKRQIQEDQSVAVTYRGDELFEDSGVFASLFKLKEGLATQNTDLLQEAIGDLDNSFTKAVEFQGSMGIRINQFESMEEMHTDQIDYLETLITSIEDVDIVQAITDLKSEQTTYAAVLAVGAQIMNVSLLDYLK
ncbi:flagellar hook-associated protein FlgL [Candidatus Formimonas warabiya]|uniref:Flagellar hook-associated protein 3 n=1 Tax=Formimonas warabiya TaxID=1761012 RepID=A0A3G1KT45_FORW1|nr:flagellar hook-associated protein FlgL [Candidatus Formimonas warabiya]ATW25693.1 flagellar hook-associated protein 3 [Candidatus Formimonas warabiya]